MTQQLVQYLVRGEAAAYRIAALLLILAILIWASPSEATIGDLVKVVYIHGALVRVAEIVFLISAALGLFYLIRQSDRMISWSWALQKTAFLYWLVSFLTSLYVMRMAWGGVNWVEPRFIATGRVLAVATIALAIGYLLEKPKVVAGTGIVMGVIVAVEISSAGLMLHPANPIGTSPSLLTKSYYYGIVLMTLILAVDTARLLLPSKMGQNKKGM